MSGSNNPSATWWQAALMIRGQTKTEQRNIRSVWIWTSVFAVSLIAMKTALEELPQLQGSLAWLFAMISIALAFQAARAHIRFIREADEFMRKVQLEGAAIGFAAGFLFCLSYFIIEQIGAPYVPIGFAIMPLGVGWAIATLIVAFRHR